VPHGTGGWHPNGIDKKIISAQARRIASAQARQIISAQASARPLVYLGACGSYDDMWNVE
jgi:hypothetical protein